VGSRFAIKAGQRKPKLLIDPLGLYCVGYNSNKAPTNEKWCSEAGGHWIDGGSPDPTPNPPTTPGGGGGGGGTNTNNKKQCVSQAAETRQQQIDNASEGAWDGWIEGVGTTVVGGAVAGCAITSELGCVGGAASGKRIWTPRLWNLTC
jgi:hypothetical protein